ncbi:hypothetical protein GCM10029992_31920 [Glycomyces albus]
MRELAASTDQPSGTGSHGTLAAASHTSGTPAEFAAIAPIGWRVPTSWLALCTASTEAASIPASGSASTRPDRSTGTSTDRPPERSNQSAACSTAECSTAP